MFLPKSQEEFEKLTEEYSEQDNTACIFASVKNGENLNQGIVGDAMAVLILLVYLIRQIAQNTETDFIDVLGALKEINVMDDV